jgi:UDP-N-acetylglucosamine 2-epimerase (non-hydrolysing)
MSMARLKVMTVLGTRPEIIRLSRVIDALDHATDHVLVHTGQNYDRELNAVFFDEMQIRRPDHMLAVARAGAAETIGNVIADVDRVLEAERPDALLVLGDTNSGLAVIAAKRRHIPIFHMEAGNRCFDQRVPEETNRRIIDHVADINLPYSAIAREYLLAEGLPPDRVIRTGSPMFEVLAHYRSAIDASEVLSRLELTSGHYILVSCHREENVDSDDRRLAAFAAMLDAVAERYNEPVLVSAHPRTRKRIDALGLSFDPRVRLMKPFGFFDYNALQMNACAVLSDSGTISEESAILNFPALNIREAHERPEAMEEGAVMMTGLSPARVLQALTILERQARGSKRTIQLPIDYAVPNVSDKVVRIILSYTDYVRRTVWHKR